jgi:hypothetical protein
MSLRDQMLKAGLITEDQAKRAAHTQRVDKKRTDRKTREAEQTAQSEEARRAKDAERAQHREQAAAQQTEQSERDRARSERQKRATAIEAAYREGAIASWEGNRRYCYAANGRIEWLSVNDDVARKLEAGHAAIVAGEKNPQRHAVLLAGGAKTLAELAPERVLTWHQG